VIFSRRYLGRVSTLLTVSLVRAGAVAATLPIRACRATLVRCMAARVVLRASGRNGEASHFKRPLLLRLLATVTTPSPL
jgi:hypothetical protein